MPRIGVAVSPRFHPARGWEILGEKGGAEQVGLGIGYAALLCCDMEQALEAL